MGRLVSILLLVALVLTPAASSICLTGSDPACCAPASEGSRSTAGGETALTARDCDCCVTVDASPVDRASSVSRPLSASMAVALLPASTPLRSRTPRAVDWLSRGVAADSRLASIRAVVLLV